MSFASKSMTAFSEAPPSGQQIDKLREKYVTGTRARHAITYKQSMLDRSCEAPRCDNDQKIHTQPETTR